MSLTASPTPAAPAPARSPVAWVLAVVLVAAAASAVVTASVLSAPAVPGGPIVITDDLGRTVHLAPDPARVVALGPNIVDMMVSLGLRADLVGVDCYNSTTAGGLASDYTPAQIAAWSLTASMCVEALPFVPATLANLTPDLVLASTIVSIGQVEQATGVLGIPFVVLQPATLSGILLDDVLLGEIFDQPARVATLNAQLSSELYNASQVVQAAATLPTVLVTYSVDAGGYWTFGPGSFGQSLVDFAGGASIGAGATTPYPELSASQVLAAQPQLIVYAVGFGIGLSTYQGGPQWSSFSAVEHGNLTAIDSTWLTEPGPTMILSGLPALLAAFHPASS